MKTLNAIVFAAGLLPGLMISQAALAFESARLWEMDITKQIGDGAAQEKTSWLCLPKADWTSPPAEMTGPQCDDQTYNREGDTLTWTAQCQIATGEGAWTFSHSDKAVEGQSRIEARDGVYLTQIDGKAVDTCTL